MSGDETEQRVSQIGIHRSISWRQTLFGQGGGRGELVSGWNFNRASFHRGWRGGGGGGGRRYVLVHEGQRGCFRAKARRICGVRAGRYQTPRAWNSPSNCIAWRHTNDCIFGSRHRVNRKTRVHDAIRATPRAPPRNSRSRGPLLPLFDVSRNTGKHARKIHAANVTVVPWEPPRFLVRYRFSASVNENNPANEREGSVERDKGEACSLHCAVIIRLVQSRGVNWG